MARDPGTSSTTRSNSFRWIERSGYNVSYSTDLDTHANGNRLLAYKGFLSVGHDEYWSKPMFDGVQGARDAGVNVSFFGANEIYWQIRLESSPTTGAPNRVEVCYKNAAIDPIQGPTTTVNWRDPLPKRPEQQLVGVQYTAQIQGQPPYIPINSGNWVYTGAGFNDGDQVPNIVGYEVDKNFSSYPQPSSIPGTFTLLSHSPVLASSGNSDYANSSIYQAPSGARVFGAGSIWWSYGLDGSYADVRIQRTTKNILDNFVYAPIAPRNVVATPGDGTVSLSWSANTEPNILGYNVYRSTSLPVSTNATPLNGATPLPSPTYVDSGLMNGVTYYYAVEAANTLGYKTAGYPASATPTSSGILLPPAPPQNVVATPGDSKVTLTWSANTEWDLLGYSVYRGTALPVSTTTPLNGSTSLASTTYIDLGLTNGTTYYYVVQAVNTLGLKGDASPVSATPQASLSAPAAPTGLTASRAGSPKNQFVNLGWTDNATNETGYIVERSVDGTTFTQLASLPANAISYRDTTVASGGKTYWYRVKAVNAAGASAPSNTPSVTTR